jgi:hypothetical protein
MLVAMRIPFSLVNLAIFLVLAILTVVGYKYSPLRQLGTDLALAPVADCDLNSRECHADIPGGGRIELIITPHPIPVLKPLQVSVALSGIKADKVEVDFDGTEMRMGYNRLLLAGSNGRFIGQTVLPVCVTGAMQWAATVLVATENRTIAAPFQFEISGG